MNKILLLFLVILCIGCDDNAIRILDQRKAETVVVPIDSFIMELPVIKPDSNITYEQIKSDINKIRFNPAFKNLPTDSISAVFTDLLLNKIIPYWYGTKWDFNGHTAIPGTGEIACGYFVSTTLSDMGLPVNRYKLAQQTPLNEAKTLSLDLPVIEIQDTSTIGIIRQMKSRLKDGIYFIGLDQSHVGYLLKRNNALFFLHSNYVMAQGVVIERVEASQVFSWFQHFYLAEISTNRTLINKWLTGENIQVISQN